MASFAKVTLIGNVTRDVEVGDANGTRYAKLALATNKKVKGQDQASFWNVTLFGKLADIAAQYVKKGNPVFIDGEISQRKYTDKNGIERLSVDVTANSIQLLGGKQETNSAPAIDAPPF